MPQKPNVWRIGDVTITRIMEIEIVGGHPHVLFQGLDPGQVQKIGWLRPHFADGFGMLHYSIHAFLIEAGGRRILVDTCVGNDKIRYFPLFNNRKGTFLSQLEKAGFPAESIDTVLCTHLHVDHVGWNTRLFDGRWIPTFPNARYLFGRIEWEYWHQRFLSNETVNTIPGVIQKLTAKVRQSPGIEIGGGGDSIKLNTIPSPANSIAGAFTRPGSQFLNHSGYKTAKILDITNVMTDSILPIIEADLHTLIEVDHPLTSEVSLMATPGHTPGHMSVSIHSNGMEAIITGDIFHHPVEMEYPDLDCPFDVDPDVARRTRREFLTTQSGRNVLILGTHFSPPTAGRIVQYGSSWRLDVSSE